MGPIESHYLTVLFVIFILSVVNSSLPCLFGANLFFGALLNDYIGPFVGKILDKIGIFGYFFS